MQEIAHMRRERSLSYRAMAARAGTSPATLLAYERGRVSPSWSTFVRVARSLGYEPSIELVRADEPSYAVGMLVGDLAAAGDDDERLRYVVEFVDRWQEASSEGRMASVAGDPGTTGDDRWDALVGGLVEHLCWHAGLVAPRWVGGPDRFLRERWWPVDLPSLRAWSLADAPAALARRGVMLGRAALDRA